jgi:hypothetical protein
MKHRLATAAVAAVAVMAPAVALAQEVPQPTLKHNPPVWLGYLVMFGMAVVVLVVSLIPSKRGHQD